jgi:hypothetical protein
MRLILWYNERTPIKIAEVKDEMEANRIVGAAMIAYGFDIGKYFVLTNDKLKKNKGVPILSTGMDLTRGALTNGFFNPLWSEGIKKYRKRLRMGLER